VGNGTVVATVGLVKAFERDSSGNDAQAKADLHVYLSRPDGGIPGVSPPIPVPQGGVKTLKFAHYRVSADGSLVPNKGSKGIAPLPGSRATSYWCVYGTDAIASLEDPTANTPKEAFFNQTDPLPLPTQWQKQGLNLVLPETRKCQVNVFNVTGDQSFDSAITKAQDDATKFYEKLKITFDFQRPTATNQNPWGLQSFNLDSPTRPPNPEHWITQFVQDPNNQGQLVAQIMSPKTNGGQQPDLSQAPWAPTGKALVAFFIKDWAGSGLALGMSFPPTPVTNVHLDIGQQFTLPQAGVIFMARMGDSYAHAFAHEIGHCLLYEPGLGKPYLIKSPGPGQPPLQVPVTAFLTNKVGMATKYADIHDAPSHVSTQLYGTSFLMCPRGGHDLQSWEVAVIRAAKELTPNAGLL